MLYVHFLTELVLLWASRNRQPVSSPFPPPLPPSSPTFVRQQYLSVTMERAENTVVETSGNVTSITLNRPAKLNALSRDMIDCLWETYTTLLDGLPTDRIHVALLKGSGGKVRPKSP